MSNSKKVRNIRQKQVTKSPSEKPYYMRSGIKVYGKRPTINKEKELVEAQVKGLIKKDKSGKEYFMRDDGIKVYVQQERRPEISGVKLF